MDFGVPVLALGDPSNCRCWCDEVRDGVDGSLAAAMSNSI